MNTLRPLVLVANIGVAIWLTWLFIVDFPESETSLLLAGLILLFILNIYFIAFSKKDNDWLGLFLKRKALEEKRKIENLETK